MPIGKWSPNRLNATQIPAACPQPACDSSSFLCPKIVSIVYLSGDLLNVEMTYLDIRRLPLLECICSIAS